MISFASAHSPPAIVYLVEIGSSRKRPKNSRVSGTSLTERRKRRDPPPPAHETPTLSPASAGLFFRPPLGGLVSGFLGNVLIRALRPNLKMRLSYFDKWSVK
jgi:hypothetical protein